MIRKTFVSILVTFRDFPCFFVVAFSRLAKRKDYNCRYYNFSWPDVRLRPLTSDVTVESSGNARTEQKRQISPEMMEVRATLVVTIILYLADQADSEQSEYLSALSYTCLIQLPVYSTSVAFVLSLYLSHSLIPHTFNYEKMCNTDQKELENRVNSWKN